MARPPGTPRWSSLLTLGAVVLGVHLWLLGGEWPDMVEPTAPAAAPPPATPTAASPAGPTATATPAPARPVTVSQVRWINAPPPKPADRTATRTARATPPKRPPAQEAPEAPPVPTPAAAPVAEAPPPAPVSPAAVEPTASLPPAAPPAAPAPPVDTQPLPPARAPASAHLNYDVSGTIRGIGYNAQATLDWTQADGRYDARMTVRLPLVGSRTQTSTGWINASGLLPERFSDKTRSERAAHFDHEQHRIRFSANTPDAELLAGAQDRLSVFVQLAARFQAAPGGWQVGQIIELQVAGTSTAEPWRFRVGEEETLNLPGGPVRARMLVREPRLPRDSLVELWLAPSLEHLPVRIRIAQDNGDQIDQILSRTP